MAARRIPGLTAPVPAAMGPTVTVSARYQNLLTMLQRVANRAGLGIEIRDLVFYVFDPVGPSGGVLPGPGHPRRVDRSPGRPPRSITCTWPVGGVGSTGSSRSTATPTRWRSGGGSKVRRPPGHRRHRRAGRGGRRGPHRSIPTPELALTALDTASQQFISDWQLGDKATVAYDGGTIVDVIREVFIDLEPNTPPLVTPTLGGRL